MFFNFPVHIFHVLGGIHFAESEPTSLVLMKGSDPEYAYLSPGLQACVPTAVAVRGKGWVS